MSQPFSSASVGTESDQYPPAKVVTDFHRNSDVDKAKEALHHTLGKGRAQASPGDHTHNGEDSAALFGDKGQNSLIFTEDLGTPEGMRAAMGKVLQGLEMLGAIDNSIK